MALSIGATVVTPAHLGAQGTSGSARVDSSGFTLEAAIAIALAHAPDIELARRQLDQARGSLEIAAAAFDVTMRSTMTRGADRVMSYAPAKPDALVPVTTNSTKYSLGADKTFRSGITISPSIGITRTAQSTSPVAPPNIASASATIAMPLLRGRAGGLAVAGERAAEGSVGAAALDLEQGAARTILDVVSTYWKYAGAQRRLVVQLQSEERAKQLLELTTVLAQADERPTADIAQAQANHASKRATRIGAEQTLLETRQAIGLALGLDASEILTLPVAASDFPPAVNWPSAGVLPFDAYVRTALAKRADLASAATRRASATLLLDAAAADMRRQLDLSVTLGYNGIQPGHELTSFFSPLYSNVPGLNASVQLGFGVPAQNRGARGRRLQSEASLQQAEIAEERTERGVRTSVAVAAMGLQRSLHGLAATELAVRLSTQAVENEKEKFRHGASTLYEQIQSEDALTTALLGEIGHRERYATALAVLRFELGELVHNEGGRFTVLGDELRVPPAAR